MVQKFSSWSTTAKLAMVSTGLTFVVLLGNAIGALPQLEPFAPATHGFVRELVELNRKAADAQKVALTAEIQAVNIGVLDLKIVAIQGQLDALNSQLNMINLRLADPQGADIDLLNGLRRTIELQIREKTVQLTEAACEKRRAESPTSAVC